LLVIYRHGGLYSDIDNVPTEQFKNGTAINPDDTFFASSDGNTFPNQNVFAMEPRHPIAAFTVQIILENLLKMPRLHRPKLVQTTGPVAFRNGYLSYLGITNPHLSDRDKKYPGLKVGF